MTTVLRAEQVTRRLPGEVPVTLVEDVSLSIERGEFICIMGPSSSGKSSLLYLLGLLDVPTAGRVWLDGEDTSAYHEDDSTPPQAARSARSSATWRMRWARR